MLRLSLLLLLLLCAITFAQYGGPYGGGPYGGGRYGGWGTTYFELVHSFTCMITHYVFNVNIDYINIYNNNQDGVITTVDSDTVDTVLVDTVDSDPDMEDMDQEVTLFFYSSSHFLSKWIIFTDRVQ